VGELVAWRGSPSKFQDGAAEDARAKLPQHVIAKDIRGTMAAEMRTKAVPEAEINGFIGRRRVRQHD
jgi:hypothetical protein